MFQLMFMMMLSNAADPMPTFQFNQLKNGQHMIVNDSVMGGVSASRLTFQPESLNFSGTVSLDNNGGFASVRMIWPFELNPDSQNPQLLKLVVKGDGQRYQLRLRTNRGFDGAAYSFGFQTLAGQEQTVYVSVDDFIPTFRGRQLRNMPKLQFTDVQQMGVLVADKQVGEFSIDLIQVSLD